MGFSGNTTYVTGQYFFIKYKSHNATLRIFSSTDYANAQGGDAKDEHKLPIIIDDNWHVLVYDMSDGHSAFNTADDGNYYVQHVRIDVDPVTSGDTTSYLEVEYYGYVDDVFKLADALGYECCTDNHLGDSHSPSNYKGEYDAKSGKYYAVCSVCGRMTDTETTGNYVINANNYTIWGVTSQGGYGFSATNGIMKISGNDPKNTGAANWGRVIFQNLAASSTLATGLNVEGKYCVFKYRIPSDAIKAGTTSVKINVSLAGRTDNVVTLTADGQWHVAVITMSEGDPVLINTNQAGFMWYNNCPITSTTVDGVTTYSYDLKYIEVEYFAISNVAP